MKKLKLIIYLLICINTTIFSQEIKITGKIKNEKDSVLPFVNVVLQIQNESDSILQGTISDLKGNYEFRDLKEGNYKLAFSFIGYKTKTILINCTENKIYKKNITLNLNTEQLSEVTVKGSRASTYANKTIYTIPKSVKLKKNSALNLIPEVVQDISLDPMNQKLSKLGGGTIKILINGLNADEKDLIVLSPKSIIKVEYYDIPPARYANLTYSAVINVITKNSERGIFGTINLQNAFTTGFGNNILSLKCNRTNTQISFTANLNYRNYNDVQKKDKLKYNIADNIYNLERNNLSGTLEYQEGYFKADLIKQKKDKVFRLTYTQNFRYANDHNKQITIGIVKNKFQDNLNTHTYDSIQLIKPVMDVYFEKRTKKKNLFVVNAVATYFRTNYKNDFYEFKNDFGTIFNNSLSNNSTKYSFISDIYYSIQYKSFSIDYGYNFHINHSYQNIKSDLISGKIFLNGGEHYIYSSVNGQWKKLSYSIQIGVDNNFYNNDSLSFNFFTLKPNIVFNFSFSQHSNLRFSYNNNPVIPSLAQLNPTQYYLEQNLIYSGNPKLKPYRNNEGIIKYSIYNSRLNLSLAADFSYAKNSIFENFINTNENWLVIQENQKFESEISTHLLTVYTPFKSKWLKLTLFEKLYYQNNKNLQNISNNLLGYMNYIGLTFNYKTLSMQIQHQNAYKRLYGNYIITNPIFSNISVRYQKKNLSIALLLAYPLYPSWHYEETTTDNAPINKSFTKDINDNGKMLYINVSYYFTQGKGFNEKNKKLNNQDTDNGILMRN